MSFGLKHQPFVICAEREMIEGKGEDCFSYSFINGDSGYISVFDGCGGMGSRRYLKASGKTGARIASRVAALVTDIFYNNQQFCFDGSDNTRLKNALKDSFSKVKNAIENDGGIMLGGDLFRTTPTTASIVAIRNTAEEDIQCEYFWAGDSRGYYLDENGLCQVTKDDLRTEEDAFTNLKSDGRMSNIIHADGDFAINERTIILSKPAMVICSTDGAFGYFQSPMDFEYILLNSLINSKSAEQWEKNLFDEVIPVAGDDFAVVIAAYGFGSFEECRRFYMKRYQYMKSNYIDKMYEEMPDSELFLLWELYKKEYYRR